jgi:hypothetical protein
LRGANADVRMPVCISRHCYQHVPIGQAPQANRLCSAGRHGLSQELRFSLFNAGRATMSADARSVTHKGSN